MELLKSNYVDTTTSIIVDSNTVSAQYLLDRDKTFQYVSSGYTAAKTTIRVNFTETLSVSRIALMGHNLKGFTAYYNGVTANTFALTNTCDTIASDFSSNSATSNYLTCNPVFCTSVSIQCNSTIVAAQEKAIGWLVISDVLQAFTRTPAAKGYTPLVNPMQIVHKLSDGGTRIQTVSDKWSASLQYSYLTQAQRDALKVTYDLHQEMIFCPFGTTTGWDEVIFPCVWQGAFEFYKFSDDAQASGFSGKINLMETPS